MIPKKVIDRINLLNDIYEKFDRKNIIIIKSEFYYILLRDSHNFVCRKIGDDLKLSTEEYEIEELMEVNKRGTYKCIGYNVRQKE